MENKKLLLIGGGGHCKSVISSLNREEFASIGILDPDLNIGDVIHDIPVIGNDDDLFHLKKEGYAYAFITLGSVGETGTRRKISKLLNQLDFKIINVIDKTASVDCSVKIGQGVFVGRHAVINADTIIHDYCIVNTGAIIEHDCEIKEYAHVAPGSVVCGNVVIGCDVHVGANCCVKQGTKIGNGVMIGMGSVVLHDVMKEMKIIGNPAKIFNGGGGS